MKNVVIISSTPRAGGNSEILATEFANGAIKAGNKVEMIYLRNYDLKYCQGCYACTKGKCIHDDGMEQLAQKLVAADVIVFATPVYFYSMSGQLKVFIDRLMPVYTQIRADIYIIATQWDPDRVIMENTINSIRGCTRDCFENCVEKGVLYGVNLNDMGEAKQNKVYMTKAFSMGSNV